MIHHGDCLDVMAGMEPESVDAVVTDPPYGLEFMGKSWDKLGATIEHPDDGEGPWGRTKRVRYGSSAATAQVWHQQWAEAAYRVAKPSAYLLAFGGTRTVHRMTVALEDAGWIIRDMLVWGYASGFPKSKASLKPAWEPIVMARKPGPLAMLAIDACRIPSPDADLEAVQRQTDPSTFSARGAGHVQPMYSPAGRWPANVILTDPIFDGGIQGVVGGGETASGSRSGQYAGSASWTGEYGPVARDIDGDSGTYSRFFLIPKADRGEREPLGSGLEERESAAYDHRPSGDMATRLNRVRPEVRRQNTHPTVKPLDLMRHLVRLVTPAGGTVLDPFLGSGTTGIAAEMEGFPWVGIEREAEYVAIAQARLEGVQRGFGLSA